MDKLSTTSQVNELPDSALLVSEERKRETDEHLRKRALDTMSDISMSSDAIEPAALRTPEPYAAPKHLMRYMAST